MRASLPLRLSGRLALVAGMLFASASPIQAEGERCYDYDPDKNVYWGDLHVHTAYSMDAYMFDTRLTPRDAYRFARGKQVKLPPLDDQGRGTLPFESIARSTSPP